MIIEMIQKIKAMLHFQTITREYIINVTQSQQVLHENF